MNSHFKNFNTSNTSFTLGEPHKGGFRVIAETTRNHIFSKENSQVMLAAMVLVPDFYCKNCQQVISAMRGNPPLAEHTLSTLSSKHDSMCHRKTCVGQKFISVRTQAGNSKFSESFK